ncbi:exodeoxyribonuclease V subunit alpha [Nocardioides sp. SYSU D00065]|uniref:exodeoxyribonuclease V subunit alpha n=1 Tax=Nocardioides sp. SYSU D00065 TaxID=2817378 RepID=UPI001B339A45|nr:exodeoxyribonuclease V subunit alpha [Nocardioides sp. SYSU D00065]
MTDIWETTDPADPRFALGATGVLGEFNAAGVLTAGDVHVARALGLLTHEADDDVLLAVALACRAVRAGSVCLDLAAAAGSVAAAAGEDDATAELPWPEPEAWGRALAHSPLVAQGVVRWEHGLVYLDRYHEQETQVLRDLAERAGRRPPVADDVLAPVLARVFPGEQYAEQRDAGRATAAQWTTVLTGGPGTGKTTTVAGLLVALRAQHPTDGPPLRVALTAPTGKASARLQESLGEATRSRDGEPDRFTDEERAWLGGLQSMTLHRLLGRRRDTDTRFRHHRGNRLAADVIVVDETSMVSLTMMARLLEAVRPDTRLVLVGDPDQLSSVEAGAVLGDLVTGYAARADSPVVSLHTSHRFGDRIGALARAVRDERAEDVLEILAAGDDVVEWVADDRPAASIRAAALPGALAARDAARAGDAVRALRALETHRMLCAHRDGPAGVEHWNRRIEAWLAAETGDPVHDPTYLGRPVLVTANDYGIGLYNGDSGVVVATADGPRVAFPAASGPPTLVAPTRLGAAQTMHAMTIHKSQGSQVDEVTVLLPDEDSRLLTRELFYTAITRARRRVRVVGSEDAVRAAVGRRAQRASGLAVRLSAAP